MSTRRETSGTDDQRYITRDDHEAARRWFGDTKRKDDRRHRKNNLSRLRTEIEKVTEGK